MDVSDLERYLRENIKVQGKTGHLVPFASSSHLLAHTCLPGVQKGRRSAFCHDSNRQEEPHHCSGVMWRLLELDSFHFATQAFIPLSKRYLKYLCKNYLQKTGTRDFMSVFLLPMLRSHHPSSWCVASGKFTYQFRYYNFEGKTWHRPSLNFYLSYHRDQGYSASYFLQSGRSKVRCNCCFFYAQMIQATSLEETKTKQERRLSRSLRSSNRQQLEKIPLSRRTLQLSMRSEVKGAKHMKLM